MKNHNALSTFRLADLAGDKAPRSLAALAALDGPAPASLDDAERSAALAALASLDVAANGADRSAAIRALEDVPLAILAGLDVAEIAALDRGTRANVARILAEGLAADVGADFVAYVEPDDSGVESPREWSTISTIWYTSSRYTLGDRWGESYQLDEEAIGAEARGAIVLPLFCYMHGPGSVRLSLGAFGCPWDSGQCGIVVVEEADAIEESGAPKGSPMTAEIRERAIEIVKGEIDTFAAWLRGAVYGYRVEDLSGRFDASIDGSCWGYICPDSLADVEAEARASLAWEIERARCASLAGARRIAQSYMGIAGYAARVA